MSDKEYVVNLARELRSLIKKYGAGVHHEAYGFFVRHELRNAGVDEE